MFIKKILASVYALLLIVLLCGCKNEMQVSDSMSSVSNVQSVVDSADTSSFAENDSIDPENTENGAQNGALIDIQKLEVKKGKANGVDVSKWQGKIDWKKVKASGIDFAIIRIGYRAENGNIYKDEYADYNIQQADKSGLLVGVYFFSTAINTKEAIEEAEWTASAIASYPISYPVVYDCEGFTANNSRMYSLTNAQRSDNAIAFLSSIEKKGYEGMMYGSRSDLESSAYWDTERIEQYFKIWVAVYPQPTYPQVEMPDYIGRYDMWQYTNMGKVNGINGNTDMIVSYFTKSKAKPKSSNPYKIATVPAERDNIYTSVNEKVTAKLEVNLREAAGTKSNIVGMLKNGDVLERTAIGTNGWSKLLYNGKTVYAISSYLTTDLKQKPIQSTEQPVNDGYTSVNEKVTAKEVVNLRDAAGTSANIVGTLKNGEIITRIAVGKNGWSKLSYNGKTVFAVSSYLTTDLSYKPTVSEPETSQPQSDGFTAVNEQVTAKSETNLRTVPSSKDSSTVVHTLKNGEYVKRIGINKASGWSKLEFNGQIVYAISSYLTE